MENDTFFTIPIGNYILHNGITNQEQFAYHEGLEFTNSRWAFDIVIAIIYNVANFNGIYVFTIIMSCIIGLSIFNVLVKKKQNIIVSFLLTLITMYFAKSRLSARAQIISYEMFIIEIYFIEKLLETQKKRYGLYLILDSIVIANFHASVWPMYFVLFLPYIAEYLFKKFKMDTFTNKLIAEEFNIKLLLITLAISIFSGLCTPIGIAPYTDMINVMSGVSRKIIAELHSVKIIEDYGMFIYLTLFMLLISFDSVKIKVSDLCLFLGLYVMGLMANRNTNFLYLVGVISIVRMINSIISTTNNMDELTQKLSKKNGWIAIICLVVVTTAFCNYSDKINQSFVDDAKYPVGAVEYIQKNLDIKNMRIFNHFNFGSYLELEGIPVFIDSRSGIYCAEFNDTNILEDYINVALYGQKNYQEVFEKYNISHVILYKNEIINTYIGTDKNYQLLYEDDNFVLYEKLN